jgi:hypothetical protein
MVAVGRGGGKLGERTVGERTGNPNGETQPPNSNDETRNQNQARMSKSECRNGEGRRRARICFELLHSGFELDSSFDIRIFSAGSCRLPNLLVPLYTQRSGVRLSRFIPGVYPSGQRGQTVNLMAYAFEGSNPSAPIRSNDLFLVPPGAVFWQWNRTIPQERLANLRGRLCSCQGRRKTKTTRRSAAVKLAAREGGGRASRVAESRSVTNGSASVILGSGDGGTG